MKQWLKRSVAPLFIGGVYIITLLLAEGDPPPEALAAHILYEARHIATHLITFAVLVLLVAWAVRPPASTHTVVVLLGLALWVGAGQEFIQWSNRPQWLWGPLLFDLLVDAIGGALGIILFKQSKGTNHDHP